MFRRKNEEEGKFLKNDVGNLGKKKKKKNG
jgi:hypothetical protein